MRPPWLDPSRASSADLAACRELMRGGSRTFFAASLLLPSSICAPASALYAFCRLADDRIDLASDYVEALAELRDRLDRVYAGRPLPIPADRALAEVVARFDLPRALLDALIEGFEWDARGLRYQDLGELYGYCARVAGTVGAMMAVLMGARDHAVLARACDLGVAMQLSNIARDVGEDARNGRLYLPLDWMAAEGLDPDAFLARPVHGEALARVVQRVLMAADVLYRRAGAGIVGLPRAVRPGIQAARFIYAEIGRELERTGLDSVSHRAVVSGRRKIVLVGRALVAAALPAALDRSPPLEQVRFLVEAVEPAPLAAGNGGLIAAVDARVGWVIDLFDRLERSEREKQAAARAGGMAMTLTPSGG